MQCNGQTKSYFQVKVHVCMFMLLLLLNVNNCLLLLRILQRPLRANFQQLPFHIFMYEAISTRCARYAYL